MLAASGFGWAILTQESAFTVPPKLFSVLGFVVFYLAISLLPLCCKTSEEEEEEEEEEGDLPLHEQGMKGNIQNGQTDSSSPDDNSSSSLFKAPPGILRSQSKDSAITLYGFPLLEPAALACSAWWVGAIMLPLLPLHSFPHFQCSAAIQCQGWCVCKLLVTDLFFLISCVKDLFLLIPCYRPNTRLWPLAVIGGALWVPGPHHSNNDKSDFWQKIIGYSWLE